jgi:hypothetical protein
LDYKFCYASHLLDFLFSLFCLKFGCLDFLSGSSRSLLHIYPSEYVKETIIYSVECNTGKSFVH